MSEKDNLKNVVQIFLVGSLLFLLWDAVESYIFRNTETKESTYQVVEVKYDPQEIKTILLDNETDSKLFDNSAY